MIRNSLRAFVCFALLGLCAFPAQAAIVAFSGSFSGSGMDPDIVPGGTLSGTFSFQIDMTGPTGSSTHIPGTFQLTLSPEIIGGVTFGTIAGNVGGFVAYQNGVIVRAWVGGAPSGFGNINGADGQSDFWVRFQSTGGPGSLPINQVQADNAAGTFANSTIRTGSVSFAVVPEPSSLLLVSIGAVVLACHRLRRRV